MDAIRGVLLRLGVSAALLLAAVVGHAVPDYLRRDNPDVLAALDRCEAEVAGMRERRGLLDGLQAERMRLWARVDDIARCERLRADEASRQNAHDEAVYELESLARACDRDRLSGGADEPLSCRRAANVRDAVLPRRALALRAAREASAGACTPAVTFAASRLAEIDQEAGGAEPTRRRIADLDHQVATIGEECRRLRDVVEAHAILGRWQVPGSRAVIVFSVERRRDLDLLLVGVVERDTLEAYDSGEQIFRDVVRVTPGPDAPDGARDFVGRFLMRDRDRGEWTLVHLRVTADRLELLAGDDTMVLVREAGAPR
ncbi:MAG: hypothetical protein H6983_07705 [Ectothiorhodospiraceae bacterium]|nr:hypothetical protein [Ectothiorhodospiraceae bacterium]